MLGISSELYNQLRKALLNCRLFSTHLELEAIFIDNRINAWRKEIPTANNYSMRIDVLINFMIDKYNANYENALVLLLDILIERTHPKDACYSTLSDIANKLRDELSENAFTNKRKKTTNKPDESLEPLYSPQKKSIDIYRIFVERFNEEEIRTFCFYLQLDYDDLPSSGKSNKVRELILYLERHDRLNDVVSLGRKIRPDISWEK